MYVQFPYQTNICTFILREIYLLKVNNFNDLAENTLDEWIYFLKNDKVENNFTAKGLKQSEEVLRIANFSDKEKIEYENFLKAKSTNFGAFLIGIYNQI